jgi:ribulose-phosphate 3-epimerase
MKRTNKNKILIAPSILSADFSKLGQEIKDVEQAGSDWIHVDVMDGHFVPNLTIGPLIVEALRPLTAMPLDCHLMVSEPENWIEPFAKAGANSITVHVEATKHLDRLINQIKDHGCLAGVSLNPGTPLKCIEEVLDIVDLVLIMTVNPGFGGQKFISRMVDKIKDLVVLRKKRNFLIQVDGGVSPKTIGALTQAGAQVFVAGTSVFGQLDRKKAILDLRHGAHKGNVK